MQKVVCPTCGLVNLSSFPSFPHCEGCARRLPKPKRHPWLFWIRHPGQALVWSMCAAFGIAVLALLSTGIARETRLRDRGTLQIATIVQADTKNPGFLVMSLRVSPPDDLDDEPIYNLRLRLEDQDAKNMRASIISPLPSETQFLGTGRYFVWKQFSPRQKIYLRLRPQNPGVAQLAANSFDVAVLVPLPISEEITTKHTARPLDLSPHRSN